MGGRGGNDEMITEMRERDGVREGARWGWKEVEEMRMGGEGCV